MTPAVNIFRKLLSPILILPIIFSGPSCKKLLDIPPNPPDRISTEQAFSDSVNVLSVMAGIYNSLGINDKSYATFFNGGITAFTALSSDELINREISVFAAQSPFYMNALLPTNELLNSMWSDPYYSLYQVNAAIKGVAESPGLTATLKSRIRGELKTIRALHYFYLVNIFGGVPIITELDFESNSTLPRSTVDEVYALIIADLEDAVQSLTEEYSSEGHARPNVFVAKALLAKVYLYREQWQQAAALSGDVINSGLYSLETDLNNVFLHGSTEAIWQLPSAGLFIQTTEGFLFVPASDPPTMPQFKITPSLLGAFELNDQRRVNWVGEIYVPDLDQTFAYPFKYKNNNAYTVSTLEDLMILRLGEQYLIRAEALAHLDRGQEAVDDLNVVRDRAGLGALSLTDNETLLADIRQERRIELFAEWGNRWFDLKRTHQTDEVLGPLKDDWEPTDELYPIPLTQIETNPFLQQNNGY